MSEPTELEKYQEMARKYENLSYALKSAEGQLILEEINATLQQVKTLLYNVAMKNISFPYEYTKEELQDQKRLRAQLDILNQITARLTQEECVKLSKTYKEKVQSLISGVPTTPSY